MLRSSLDGGLFHVWSCDIIVVMSLQSRCLDEIVIAQIYRLPPPTALATLRRSLVNENSDTWVVKQLGEELMSEFRRLGEEEGLGWTQIMNRQMRSLWEKGVGQARQMS